MGCVGPSDYIKAAEAEADAIRQTATVDAAITAVIALWKRNSQNSIMGMRQNIADRKQILAEYVFTHASKFWPFEKSLVDDAFAVTKAEPAYLATSLSWSNITKTALGQGRGDWMQELNRRCLQPTSCEDIRWRRESGRLQSDSTSFADRFSEAKADALNDQRYARMYAALGIGRGVLNNVNSFQNLMGLAGDSAAGALASTINSGKAALGFYLNRDRVPDGWGQNARQNAYFERRIFEANNPRQNSGTRERAPRT